MRPFWKRWPIICLSLLIAISISTIGTLFFLRARDIMEEQLKQRLENTAAAAALFIDGDALDTIHTRADKGKPEFYDIVQRLQSLRSMQDVRFAYILRRTADPLTLTFVADADSLSTLEELDVNHDGFIEQSERASNPGDIYDVTDVPPLQGDAFNFPTSDSGFTYDQWGSLISGYAPIFRKNGTVAGTLGIDMKADQFLLLSQSAFSPFALLLVVFFGIVIAAAIVMLWEHRQILILNRINLERSGLLKLTFHQLGEPLTIMKWSLETLREDTESPELKKLVEDHVSCMDEGLGRLNSIIDTLQLAEKVDLNTLEYIPQSLSLKGLLDNAVNEWMSSAVRKKQTIDLLMDGDIIFPFDYTMLSLVMRQLLQNAVEYSPEGATITLRVVQAPDKVKIAVEDTGLGIPASDMEHLFEKYRRASNAAHIKPDGNGLGLYIAKGVVECAGGNIWVQSNEGKGTKVIFTLPIRNK